MGLNDEEVLISRKKYGSNALTKIKKNSFLHLLIESLGDPIIKILLIALMIKVVFLFQSFDWFETIGILIAVFLATFISSISEYGSETAFAKLQSDTDNILIKVIRNNNPQEIRIDELVVGDIVILSSGDKVPADGYLLNGFLSLDESSLNGETKEVKKIPISSDSVIIDGNMVYRGSVVYTGSSKMKVLKVGDNTIYGNISKELQENIPDSPLKIRLRGLAKVISRIGYLGALLVVFSYLFSKIVINNNFDSVLIMQTLTNFHEMADYIIYALTLSVTIIVVAVPEGLPMMITLVLSSNMKKMLKDNVLVRKLVGIETAGSLNLLLTDKTGTLTKGKLKIAEVITHDGIKYRNAQEFKRYPNLDKMLRYSFFYNNESILTEDNIIGGNSTDKALMSFLNNDFIYKAKIINKIPFNSENKYSIATIYDKEELTLIKGAAEVILPKCSKYFDKYGNEKKLETKRFILKELDKLTLKGSRVIVLAKTNETDYTFIALVGIKDELREEAIQGVSLIKDAGINIIMITGDSKETAKVIAKEAGLINSNNDMVISSEEFNHLSDEDIIKKLDNIKVIARALPQDKSRLVRIAQEIDLIVGMTGDGVNDAPALKKANVGFAMGSGTEVAKEASEIVILDDNIISISKAILYGRTIFKSIRKFIIYQLSVNACALILSVLGLLIGIDKPITIVQMLWLNMIMDTFAGLAFAFEPPLLEYMKEKPKSKKEPIVNFYMYSQIVLAGVYSSLLCILFLKLPIIKEIFRTGPDNMYLFTAYFALFIFLGIFNAFNARTERINIFANILKNRVFLTIFCFILCVQIFIIYYGGHLFRTFGLTTFELILITIIALSVVPADWLRKIFLKKNGLKIGV